MTCEEGTKQQLHICGSIVVDADSGDSMKRTHRQIALCNSKREGFRDNVPGLSSDEQWCGMVARSNGEAQPPADEYGVLNRYGEPHETGFQNRRDSAGRLERNVGREQTSIITFPNEFRS